jgi:hypothetical protein
VTILLTELAVLLTGKGLTARYISHFMIIWKVRELEVVVQTEFG